VKILAVDPGEKRVGLAACDELQLTTRRIPVLHLSKQPQWIQALAQLILVEEFVKVLWGLPLNMDGSEGKAATRSRRQAGQLERELQKQGWTGELTLWDERLTSYAAEEHLRERGIPKAVGKDFLDSLAAQILLEDFLKSCLRTQR
jgi:putative Holliday junction resolvase